MDLLTDIRAMQRRADALRAEGRRLALVPTMGALHDGHLSLVRAAAEQADHVTVSIFVNPTQFVAGEDLDAYPRPVEDDLRKLRALDMVDVVFMPAVNEMYPDAGRRHLTWVVSEEVDRHLCGQYRDGHFRGVTTVVTKLFNACKPHLAVFGRKDAQQFLVLKRMVFDLNIDVELAAMPTFREADGLAASSRNVYLTAAQRAQAPVIHRALQAANAAIEEGETDPARVRTLVAGLVETAPEARVQYVDVVDTDAVQPVARLVSGSEVLVAAAVFFGSTRLIDNVFVRVP